MRSITFVCIASIVTLTGCDLLKHQDNKGSSAAGSATTSSGNASGASSSSGSDNATTNANDTSKGGTSGCAWPEDSAADKDITITKGCSVVAKNSIRLREGATMTIEQGVKIAFDTDVYLWVEYGKLIVKGTTDAPVTFTSANKSPAAGDWVGIGFQEKTMAGTSLDHLIIEYAGSKSSNGEGAIRLESMRQGGRISITNSSVRASAQFGLVADDNGTFAKFENNTFKDNKLGSLNVVAEMLGTVGRGNTFSQPIHVKESTVDQTTTWPPFDVPVFVDGNIQVKSDSSVPTLTIADKTVLKMGQDRYFGVGDQPGALVAKNVTFTSASASPSEGDWATIFIYRKSSGTDIENCTFEYFGSDTSGAKGAITLWGMNTSDLKGVTITNNTFRKGKQQVMHSDDNKCAPLDKSNKVEGSLPFCSKP